VTGSERQRLMMAIDEIPDLVDVPITQVTRHKILAGYQINQLPLRMTFVPIRLSQFDCTHCAGYSSAPP
jgi:hypothetical protein